MAQIKYLDLEGLKKLFGIVDNKISTANASINAEVEKKADKTELEGLASETYVDSAIEDLNINQYAVKTEVENTYAKKSETYTKGEVDSAVANAKSEILGGAGEDYDTLKEIEEWVEEHQDLYAALVTNVGKKANAEDVYSKQEVDAAIQEAVDEVDVTEDLKDYAKTADVNKTLEDYAKKSEIPTDYLTEEDLENYATEEWVEGQNYLTEEDLPTFVAFSVEEIENAAKAQ